MRESSANDAPIGLAASLSLSLSLSPVVRPNETSLEANNGVEVLAATLLQKESGTKERVSSDTQ